MASKDYYDVLELEIDATDDEIKKKYRKLALKLHPDKQTNKKQTKREKIKVEERFQVVKEAYETLSDKTKRREYDKNLHKELQKLKRQRERDAALNSKRRKMKDELLQREETAAAKTAAAVLSTKQDEMIKRLREEGKLKQLDRMNKMMKKDKMKPPTEQRKKSIIRVKWNRKKTSYSEHTLLEIFKQYGRVESIILKEGLAPSARIIMETNQDAMQAVKSQSENMEWKEISLVGQTIPINLTTAPPTAKTEPILSPAATMTSFPSIPATLKAHLEFEAQVLEQLRVAATRQRISCVER